MNSKVVETVLTLVAIVATLHYASNMLGSSKKQKFTEVKEEKTPEPIEEPGQDTSSVENEDTDFFPYKSKGARANVTPGSVDVPMMTAVDNSDPKNPQPDDDFYGEFDIPSEYGAGTTSKATKEELSEMEEEVKKNMEKSRKESNVKPYDDEEEDFGAVVADDKKEN